MSCFRCRLGWDGDVEFEIGAVALVVRDDGEERGRSDGPRG